MKNKYNLILTAGSRIHGVQKFSSETERLHHLQHIKELKYELGPKLLNYFESLGFMEVELTEEEAEKYRLDHRVYDLSKVEIAVPHSTQFIKRDVASNNQWHLKQLSNRMFSSYGVLSGFKLEMVDTLYGIIGVEYINVCNKIIITSTQNKLVYNKIVYNYELETSNGTVATVFSTNSSAPLDEDVYIGYNLLTDNIELQYYMIENFLPLYTVKIKKYYDNMIVFWSHVTDGILGFYDLKPVEEAADTYTATVEGEGVDIIIGDTQLNIYAEDIAGRASIAFNAYADIYIDEYGAWDSNNPLIDGHGTACAHAAAGTISGVANKAKITGVTCLDISDDRGNLSNRTLAGLTAILDYIIAKKDAAAPKPYPIVVNLSLGSATNNPVIAYDSCVTAMVNEGAIVCIAAGNDNVVHNSSPYTALGILVGASDEALMPASFTNYGPHVDVYSPGVDIFSTMTGNWSRWQGTSVATPNLAGLCALFLSMYPEATPAEVKRAVLDLSIEAITYNKDATTNRFAQNPIYGFIDKSEINTAKLQERLIYTAIPYFIGYDGELVYGSMQELTVNSVASAVVSAGQSESVEIATVFRLVP